MRGSIGALAAAGAMALAFAVGVGFDPASVKSPRAATSTCLPPAHPYARLELLFGASRPDGREITATEWQAFLDAEVTPRFPDGLTVLEGRGQWRNGRGEITREPARVLLVWHVPTPRTETDIAAIRTAYRRQFAQESVMRVDGTACVSFE